MSADAIDRIDRLIDPTTVSEIISAALPAPVDVSAPLADLPGRVLAETITSDSDHPPFAASTMDGYAVVAADPLLAAGGWAELTVVGSQYAGTVADLRVEPGQAAYITTGAPLPPGADAVIMVERTDPAPDGRTVRVDTNPDGPPAPGDRVRPVGSDLAAGEVVLPAGTVLTPAAIGLLASVGRTEALVAARPRVSVLSTGDELVEPDQIPAPGQIRDSNRYALLAALAPLGAEIVYAGHAPDDEGAQRAFLAERLADSDVLVTSGGVSMGRLDLMKKLLVELTTVHFRQVRMRPGKPFTFATAGKTLVFSLPGNPVSTLVGFELFVRPALLAMQRMGHLNRPRRRVRLGYAIDPIDRIDYQRVTLIPGQDGNAVAVLTGSQASSRLSSLATADALAVIPPRETSYREGEIVEAILLT